MVQMKRNYAAACLASILVLTGIQGAAVSAAEDTGTEAAAENGSQAEEAVTEAAEEAAEEETEKAEDFTVEAGDVSLSAVNYSGQTVEKAEYAESGTGSAVGEAGGTLTITLEDGTDHVFESFDPAVSADFTLTEEDGFLFMNYIDADGGEATFYETADETVFDQPEVRYVTNEAYIREKADPDSEAIAVAALGSEVKALAAEPKWIKVSQGDVTGYISRSCVSASKADAESAVSADNAEAARKAAEAAAAEAAAQQAAAEAAARQAAAQQETSADSGSSGVYEVSRENIDDCDGSGHGVTIITYSDGSTREENY